LAEKGGLASYRYTPWASGLAPPVRYKMEGTFSVCFLILIQISNEVGSITRF